VVLATSLACNSNYKSASSDANSISELRQVRSASDQTLTDLVCSTQEGTLILPQAEALLPGLKIAIDNSGQAVTFNLDAKCPKALVSPIFDLLFISEFHFQKSSAIRSDLALSLEDCLNSLNIEISKRSSFLLF